MANHQVQLTAQQEKVILYYFGNVGNWVKAQAEPQAERYVNGAILQKVRELLEAGLPIPDTKQAIFNIIDLNPVPFPGPPPMF